MDFMWEFDSLNPCLGKDVWICDRFRHFFIA
jgi:hypothetical protein